MTQSTIKLFEPIPEDLMKQWRKAAYNKTGAETLSPYINCLLILLEKMDWKGSAQSLIDAFPYDGVVEDVTEVRNIMARLGFRSKAIKTYGQPLTARLCPILYTHHNEHPHVACEDNESVIYIDGVDQLPQPATKKFNHGKYYLFEKVDIYAESGMARSKTWLRHIFSQFKSLIRKAFLVSFVVNILTMTIPLSIMLIYDQVIAKESKETLVYVATGIMIALAFELIMRLIRAKEQAYVGARLDYLIGTKVFEQILHLPPMFTERAPVEGQIGRIRSFETMREAFSGSLATTLLDLPFVLLFLVVIGFIGGPLIVVPLVMVVLYAVIAFVGAPEIVARTAAAQKSRAERHSFMMETIWQLRAIKQRGGEDTWYERYRKLSGSTAWYNLNLVRYQKNIQNMAQTIMMASGVATLVFGVLQVMNQNMSLGALVAIMMLVWRVLAPIQALFNLGDRLEQLHLSYQQLCAIVDFNPEQEPQKAPQTNIEFTGSIEFNRVSMRYTRDANPAVLGMSLKIAPKEMLAITGHSGSGKTTMAKLMLGMYRPQGGAMLLDDVDLRQLKPITLRQTMAYVPQINHAFPGTLYDNLIMANPTASFAKVRKACREVEILKAIEALPDGFETEFKEGLQTQVPQSFLRKMALARALLRDAPIYIFDEPSGSMDDKDEQVFIKVIEKLKGKKTVVMVTQRPSHMRMADRLLVLKEGQLDLLGPPDQVLERLFAKPKPAQGNTS